MSEATAPGRPDEHTYNELLMTQWHALLDSPASREERLVHTFLEHHPSLLPGSASVDGDSGHAAYPMGVITRPKLPGLSDREPDFIWLATDSESLYPVLIEIETPHKQWFYGNRAEIHSDLTHAQGQLAEWRAWFSRGSNQSAFLDAYEIPPDLRRRRLSPRFVLVHGRRGDYENSQLRQMKRAELAREDERLMSFDRLNPAKWGVLYSCLRKRQDGYEVVAVPPALTIFNDGEHYRAAHGWGRAIDGCVDMPSARRDYLKLEMHNLINPDGQADTTAQPRYRRVRWL